MKGNPIENLTSRFVRRTKLKTDEARIRFCQIDRDAIDVVTSAEASRVTNLMSKVYLRLVNAPTVYWETQGVLRFTGEERREVAHRLGSIAVTHRSRFRYGS
ncbi:MAG: hypothetical protein WKF84_02000 [Pyrinomonadaceae bacterium]